MEWYSIGMNLTTRQITAIETATASNKASVYYNSWNSLVRYMAKAGYNETEIETILSSDVPLKAVKTNGNIKSKNSHRHTCGHLRLFLEASALLPRSKGVNVMVAKNNPDLVLNDAGVLCHNTTSAMNGARILVPVGTPRSCDPSSELYWSM